jgi:hypothetical protein
MNRRSLYLGPIFFFVLLLAPVVVSADGLSGVVELDYFNTKLTTEEAGGLSTDSHGDSFIHRYFLNLDKTIYPNLKFLAGGTFEQQITKGDEAGVDIDTKDTQTTGFLNLDLSTRFISAGAGYTRREEKTSSHGQTTVPDIRETYSANLGLRPEGLPDLDMLFLRTKLYDEKRLTQNVVTDTSSFGLKYMDLKNLELRGNVLLTDQKDKLQDIHINQDIYTARAVYSRRFFRDRVSAYATYTYNRLDTKVTAKGSGLVDFPVFPFFGLSGNSDTPENVSLDLNPALIDADVTASAGINIGVPPFGGDTRKRNIGLDFINPGEVNLVYLWVDRELPPAVSNSFSWDVYISSDNLNWTFWRTVSPAPFGSFTNRFEISFSAVSTRYLKVVTRPLSPVVVVPPGTDVSNIFVTEMQAFFSRSAQDVTNKQTQTQQTYDLNVRTLILDRPNLNYDFYYWGSSSDPGFTTYVVSNALNLSHRFNNVFSGTARISREDAKEALGNRSSNMYGVSLNAVPLPTLFHSLTVSGRFEHSNAGDTSSNSIFLNNSAALYKGVNVNLGLGASLAINEADVRTVSTIVSSGASLMPHPAMDINMNFSMLNTRQHGGSEADVPAESRRADISVSYTPFSTLYLYASYGMTQEANQKTYNQSSYSLSWSPLQGGDLQLNFIYNESLTADNEKQTTTSPGLRWLLRPNATLDVAYTIQKNDSPAVTSDQKTFSLRFTMVL